MIEEAAKAGADMVKFQSFRGKDARTDDPEREWFCKVELSDSAHYELNLKAPPFETSLVLISFEVFLHLTQPELFPRGGGV